MFKSAGHTFFTGLLAGTVLALSATSALADGDKKTPYVMDKQGNPVIAKASKNCVMSPNGTDFKPFEVCGDKVGDADSDGDGVPDDKDNCPNTPKDVKVDENGCPADSDGDGVPDYLDKCPDNNALQISKGVDASGCPVDNDGDGVPDYRDDCPNTPADLIHKVNNRGCAPTDQIVRANLDDKVNFAFDKATLTSKAKATLDALVEKVINNTMHVVRSISVTGHTDNIGSDKYNQGLSERRANAVAGYLKGKGVSQPMTVKGEGESKPLNSNATKADRAANRRVVIDVGVTKK